ncbi:MAG: hypothetical protein AABZ39_16000, partial [Spirochaetota bacterium]
MGIPDGMLETLKKVSEVCTSHNLRYCLAGGLAVGVIAAPRATEDIDITLLMEISELPRLKKILSAAFDIVQFNEKRLEFADTSIQRVVIRGKGENIIILDILLPVHPIYRSAVENAIPITIDGIVIYVSRPEDLILMKSLSSRPQD